MAGSTRTDPFEQQHRQYDAQYEAIGAMYDPEDGTETDWKSLAPLVEEALNDPALPRLHRAEFHIINAWYSNEPEVKLGFAREVIDDMVQVLQADGRSLQQIDARLMALREMFDLTEGAVKRTRDKEAIRNKNRQEGYANSFREVSVYTLTCCRDSGEVEAKAQGDIFRTKDGTD